VKTNEQTWFSPVDVFSIRMKKIAFIINPISGNRHAQEIKRTLPEYITRTLKQELWSPTVVQTGYAGHATELAKHYAESGYDAVVAVGGDGTVNEVARGLRDTQTAMGILPMGSGNGLARHLGIPMDTYKAVCMLNQCEPALMDYGIANDHLFVCTCGTGFDAMVADRFAKSARRGFMTYLKTIFHLVFTYKSQTYRLTGDGVDETHKAFLITFANANQWGNAARIAPNASLQDGLMDVMIMSSRALLGSLPLAVRLFAGTIDKSPMMHTIRAGELILRRESAAPFHIDGDPVALDKDIHLRIVKGGLRVLVAKR